MKISEIFTSIQGEGKYVGMPGLFIRTSGCTRACSWCDTKYHINGKEISNNELIEKIKKTKLPVIWTGGEPLLQRSSIKEIISKTETIHHIETNGDLLTEEDFYTFDYLGISPKELSTAKKIKKLENCDIKVVTDLEKIGVDMIRFATCLMPLTTNNKEESLEIMKKVWDYCVLKDIYFSTRLQYLIYGSKKNV